MSNHPEVPARHPGDGKDAPRSYVKVRAED